VLRGCAHLLRCAFHLGNRHTQAQVGDGFLRIRKDPVLKEMLEGLQATVTEERRRSSRRRAPTAAATATTTAMASTAGARAAAAEDPPPR
jgi:urease accessory protein UreE